MTKIICKEAIKSPNDEDMSEGVPLRVAKDMVTGLQQIDQFERGELSLPSWEDMMSELRHIKTST